MNIIGPTSIPPPVASAAAVTNTATILQSPTAIQVLPPGTILQGTVTGKDASGHFLVNTANGTIALTTSLPLPTGTTLSLQVQTAGSQLQTIILAVNGEPPGKAGSKAPLSSPSSSSSAGSTAAGGANPGSAVITTGSQLSATIVRASTGMPSPVSQGSAGVAGSIPAAAPGAASGALGGILPSSLSAAAPLAGALGAYASRQGQNPPGQTPLPSPATPAPLPAGSRLDVHLVRVETTPQNPAALLSATAKTLAPNTPLLAGTVTGANAQGQPQITTPLGVLSLNAKASLPPGSVVVFEILGGVRAENIPLGASAEGLRSALLSLGKAWPNMSDALKALSSAGTPAASAALAHLAGRVLPAPGAAMAAQILFLMNALRGGNFRDWIGANVTDALQQSGRGDLLTKLVDDFGQMMRIAQNASAEDWRLFLIPLYDGKDLHMLRLHTRQHRREKGKDGREKKDSRFLLDVELSQLGAMQFDGLVYDEKFDLLVRSHKSLPEDIQGHIAGIYNDSLSAGGYRGSIHFTVTRDFVPPPVNPSLPEGGGGLSVGVTV